MSSAAPAAIPFSAAPPKQDRGLIAPLLTKQQAADVLGCCLRTVDNAIQAGTLPVVKIGTLARVDPRDLAAVIDARKERKTLA